ncbi:Nn.00g053100.m01.CDS01 [Neocucurbitaria sp. VM-36]
MGITVFMFVPRKPGISLEAFKDHYENKHVPLVLKALGDAKPVSHTRYYCQRNPAAQGDAEVPPPLLYVGDPSTIDYDCITTVELEDEAHFKRFNEAFETSPLRKEIEEDQNLFADSSKFKVLAVETLRVTRG